MKKRTLGTQGLEVVEALRPLSRLQLQDLGAGAQRDPVAGDLGGVVVADDQDPGPVGQLPGELTGPGRGAMAAQIHDDHPEIRGEIGLRAKKSAMRHQPVQQHERRARALVAIGDSRPVRGREKVQKSLPAVTVPTATQGSIESTRRK